MIEIILLEPRKQENIGSVARAMKNFDFQNLVLINPKCKIGDKANRVAKHARDILKKTKIKNFSYIKKFDYLIGTTAILGTDYNILRNPINASQLAAKISKLDKKTKIGLWIGRETIGLKNEELEMCDILVTVPSSKKYPTLNISHSTAIMLYEIFNSLSEVKSNSHINFASKKDKEIIMMFINKILNKIEFTTKQKKETQKKVWKRVIGKALLTKREAFAVMGFFRKLKR